MLGDGPFCCILTWLMAKVQKETNTVSSPSRTEEANLLPEILKTITLSIRAIPIRSYLSTLLH